MREEIVKILRAWAGPDGSQEAADRILALLSARVTPPATATLDAEDIVNSKPVISVFAACEWDELSEDGQAWVEAIIKETASRVVTPPAGAGREGWVLVPKEPTQAMRDAVSRQVDDFSREGATRLFTRDLWAAMIAAAPAPTDPTPEPHGGMPFGGPSV
jgi:hypothetical protein